MIDPEEEYKESCAASIIAEAVIARAQESARLECEAIARDIFPDQTIRYWAVGRWHLLSPWHPGYHTALRDCVCDRYDARCRTWRPLP